MKETKWLRLLDEVGGNIFLVLLIIWVLFVGIMKMSLVLLGVH